MNKILKNLMCGGVFFCLPLMFTSCGNADNPSDSSPSSEEIAAALASIEIGEKITINFTYGDDPFYATFQKTGETTYVFLADESSLPPDDSPFLTRSAAMITYSADIKNEGGKIIFSLYQNYADARLIMQVTFNPADDTYEVVTDPQYPAVFKNIKIGDAVPSTVKDATKVITVTVTTSDVYEASYQYSYHEGETWGELIARYKEIFGEYGECTPAEFSVDEETGKISEDFLKFYYDDGITPVLSTDVVCKDGKDSYKMIADEV